MSIRSILVLCIGNICRSPMAAGILAKAVDEAVVTSAGTGALVGQPADRQSQLLMSGRGIDISGHVARQLSSGVCREADLILVMDQQMRRHVENLYPFATGKTFRIGEFSSQDILDPYRQSPEIFEQALAAIDIGLSHWIERIKRI